MYTCRFRLYVSCSCIGDEETDPVRSHSYMTVRYLSAYAEGEFMWQHTKGSRGAAVAFVWISQMCLQGLHIPLSLITKDQKKAMNHFPRN